jgi:AcrR family transcriptional regulator
MGRKSSVDEQAVYMVVAGELAKSGRFTIESLTAATGLSMGSIYHRFGSREGLMAETWLDAVTQFQIQFITALEPGTLAAGLNAALSIPRFCRANRDQAIVLACCRQSEFVGGSTPAHLRQRVVTANDNASIAIRRFAKAVGRPLLACRLALVAYPLGAVRLHLPHSAVPRTLDKEIAKAARAALM